MNSTYSLRRLLSFCVLAFLALGAVTASAQDSKIKSWTTAELHGAMKWAKERADDRRERSEFGAAEIVCYRRIPKQIDDGAISRASVLLISENTRKRGIYKGERLTMARAHELRRMIIGGRLLESLRD
jgi:hypothetical protein